MKFKYDFGNGESREIEISEEWYDILFALDEEEARNNRKETRRHSSLTGMDYEGEWFAAPDVDVFQEVLCRFTANELQNAMRTLTPCQQELVRRVFLSGESLESIAREEGVTGQAIGNRLAKIYARLKKHLC